MSRWGHCRQSRTACSTITKKRWSNENEINRISRKWLSTISRCAASTCHRLARGTSRNLNWDASNSYRIKGLSRMRDLNTKTTWRKLSRPMVLSGSRECRRLNRHPRSRYQRKCHSRHRSRRAVCSRKPVVTNLKAKMVVAAALHENQALAICYSQAQKMTKLWTNREVHNPRRSSYHRQVAEVPRPRLVRRVRIQPFRRERMHPRNGTQRHQQIKSKVKLMTLARYKYHLHPPSSGNKRSLNRMRCPCGMIVSTLIRANHK